MLRFMTGDMFEQDVDIYVNAVNCVGVMGTGIALEFKKRYPDMFKVYKKICDMGRMVPGELHIWREGKDWIINLPTKRHWRHESSYYDVEHGLVALRGYLQILIGGRGHLMGFGLYKSYPIRVALPALGCGHGGLDWIVVSEMIQNYLGDLEVEILAFLPQELPISRNRTVPDDPWYIEDDFNPDTNSVNVKIPPMSPVEFLLKLIFPTLGEEEPKKKTQKTDSKKDTTVRDNTKKGGSKKGRGGKLANASSIKSRVLEISEVDCRLSIGSLWRRKSGTKQMVRVALIEVATTGAFKGNMVVLYMPLGGGGMKRIQEEVFLRHYEPVLSVVRNS